MKSLTYLTLDQLAQQLHPHEIDALARQISGGVLSATDDGYDEARKVWNGSVDRRPALIARCLTQSFAEASRVLRAWRGFTLTMRKVLDIASHAFGSSLFHENLNVGRAA